MTNIRSRRAYGISAWLVALFVLVAPLGALAQTRVEMPKNRYSTRDDVQAGREAAQQVYQQMPILRDSYVSSYVQDVGRRLVSAIPAEFRHSEFSYSFDVVNARDINAFALPGGPMFVNRGMIEAARNEGEMAGVMAHEISHVALRHATAQATETQKYQVGSVLGQIAGAVIGGGIGQVVGGVSQVGFGAAALKYSRKYETQADILGAQIMARAGYDPRDLANMFRTIAQQGGGGRGPEWLSSHPDPGNRYQRINQEAALLRVNSNNATQDTRAFQQAQARLRGMGRAPTMEEIARSGQRYPNQGGGQRYPDERYPDERNPDDRYPDDRYPQDTYGRGERVAYPSSSYRTETNNLFRVSVPSNWRQVGSGESATYAPEGAYGSQGITHGVIFGVSQTRSRDLQSATREVLEGLLQQNNYLRQSGGYQRANLGGRTALATSLFGRSNITGRNEQVTIVVTQLSGGETFYMAAVAPQNEYGTYRTTFDNIMRSIQLSSRY